MDVIPPRAEESGGPLERAAADAALLDALPFGVALLDQDLQLVRVNRALAALLGTTEAAGPAAPGRPPSQPPGRLCPQFEALLRHARDSGRSFLDVELALELPPGSGPRRWRASAFPVDPPAGGPCVGLTLTPAGAEADPGALRDREELFRAVFDRAAVGILAVEWRGSGTRVNPALLRMLGYTEAELTALGVQGITHPADFAADREFFQRLMSGAIDSYELEKRYLRKDGSLLYGHMTVSLARDVQGRPDLVIAMVQDVTGRRRAEAERDGLIRKLEEAVSAREVFLSIVSHELRTPLTSLQLSLHVLRRKLNRVDGPPAEVDIAVRQTERLAALVEALLDVSRLGEGPLALRTEAFDLGAAARAVVERLRPAAEQEGCPLHLRAEAPVAVRADRTQIEQVLGRVLANAIKFGAGHPIEVSVEAAADKALLRVRDHGIGIAAEDQERIFGRFERAVSELQYGGLGLGLYLSRHIVEAHGGRLRVDSRPGEGATFIMELPLS